MLTFSGIEASNLPPGDRLDAWVEYHTSSHPFDLAISVGPEGPLFARDWQLGMLGLNVSSIPQMRVVRSPRRRGLGEIEYVNIRYVRGGSKRALVGDVSVRMNAGEFHLMDASPDFRFIADLLEWRAVRVPYGMIGYDPSVHPAHICIPDGTKDAWPLHRAFDTMVAAAAASSPQKRDDLVASSLVLFRAAFGFKPLDARSAARFRAERNRAMFDWIDANLHRPDLSIAELQRQFGASRATIFRVFEPRGGVANHLIRRRVERAFADLSSTAPERGAIGRVARKWGFAESGNFAKTFRRHLGLSPSDATLLGALASKRALESNSQT